MHLQLCFACCSAINPVPRLKCPFCACQIPRRTFRGGVVPIWLPRGHSYNGLEGTHLRALPPPKHSAPRPQNFLPAEAATPVTSSERLVQPGRTRAAPPSRNRRVLCMCIPPPVAAMAGRAEVMHHPPAFRCLVIHHHPPPRRTVMHSQPSHVLLAMHHGGTAPTSPVAA